jgi:hypothetical protein
VEASEPGRSSTRLPGVDETISGDEIFAEAARIERICLRWVRAYRQAADFWNRVHVFLGVPSVALATAAGASVLADRFRIIAGILALFAATFSGLMTWLDPRAIAELHRSAANGYLGWEVDPISLEGDAGESATRPKHESS